jgi:hypothetical protein
MTVIVIISSKMFFHFIEIFMRYSHWDERFQWNYMIAFAGVQTCAFSLKKIYK